MSIVRYWLGCLVVAGSAQSISANEIAIPHTREAIVVDADLSEPQWQQARAVELEFDTWPAENVSAPVVTDLERNPNNTGNVDAHKRSLGTQLLYSYKVNPQTLFFAGYSDNSFSDDEIEHLVRDQRSVFLKFSYAWML